MSFEPPGGEVTMSRIGLLGKGVCPSARPKEHSAASSTPRAVLMRLPPPSIRSYAEKVRMQECEHEVQSEPGEHFAPPDFVEPELVAPLHDRREREVGGRHGKTLPVHADHSVLAPILQHRTRRREQQKPAEENQRSGVP